MQIRFEIDMDYDIQMITHMLRGGDWEYRAKKMNLPVEVVKEINKASDDKLPKAVAKLKSAAEETYQYIRPYMQKTLEQYQSSWDEIMNSFSNLVEDKSSRWFYEEYICKLTNYNPGLSNWNGNVVGRWWKENPYRQRRITAHEVLLAHFFSIHRNNYFDSGINDKQIWALAEIFGFAMTGLDEDIKKFWPWDRKGYYIDHNYPQIVDLQLALEKPFLNYDFDKYVKTGIDLVKEMYTPEWPPSE